MGSGGIFGPFNLSDGGERRGGAGLGPGLLRTFHFGLDAPLLNEDLGS